MSTIFGARVDCFEIIFTKVNKMQKQTGLNQIKCVTQILRKKAKYSKKMHADNSEPLAGHQIDTRQVNGTLISARSAQICTNILCSSISQWCFNN